MCVSVCVSVSACLRVLLVTRQMCKSLSVAVCYSAVQCVAVFGSELSRDAV